ncbi:hypothetical protein [Variovorax sp. LjRoot178]|uniref:hypothetical protein n=1 Tax=Variovorax sp. LjRoot178 TaxID=3342277 RepID=UPI003F50E7A4
MRPHPGDPDPNLLIETSPRRCATAHAWPRPWCGAAGSRTAGEPRPSAGARNSSGCPGTRCWTGSPRSLWRVKEQHGGGLPAGARTSLSSGGGRHGPCAALGGSGQ